MSTESVGRACRSRHTSGTWNGRAIPRRSSVNYTSLPSPCGAQVSRVPVAFRDLFVSVIGNKSTDCARGRNPCIGILHAQPTSTPHRSASSSVESGVTMILECSRVKDTSGLSSFFTRTRVVPRLMCRLRGSVMEGHRPPSDDPWCRRHRMMVSACTRLT